MELRTIKLIDFWVGGILIFFLKPLVLILGMLFKINHEPTPRNNLTIIKLLGGGSLLLAYPSLLGLKEKYPQVKFRIVTTTEIEPFAKSLNIFDEIFLVNKTNIVSLIKSSMQVYGKVFHSDTIIDLEVYSRLSTVFTTITFARNRIGFYLLDAFWRRNLMTHLVYFNRFSPVHHFYEKLVTIFDAKPTSLAYCCETITKSLTPFKQKYRICIGHGCSDLGKERMLNSSQWQAVFKQHLPMEKEGEVFFLGSFKDAALADEVISKVQAATHTFMFVNKCGKCSFAESLSILLSCDEFWGIDSALLHYARLFGKKCLSWWGPTDPSFFLQQKQENQDITFYEKIPCSPCIHVTETPPCQGDNICIQNLFSPEKREWIGIIDT